MHYTFISDQPVYESHDDSQSIRKTLELGFDRYADILAQHAVATTGPFAIGIHAPWGQGKTSLLRAIENSIKTLSLSPGQAIIPIRFNAWQFENEKNMLVPLLLTIVAELRVYEKRHNRSTNALHKAVKSCLTIVAAIESGISLAVPATGITLSFDKMLSNARKAAERSNAHEAAAKELAKEAPYYSGLLFLHEACKELAKSGTVIVMFIDDLDRCPHQKALAVLENIKLVLSQPGFVFFLAVDNIDLEKYIAEQRQNAIGKIENSKSSDNYGSKYLEKLIQVSFKLPQPERDGARGYDKFLRSLFTQMSAPRQDPIRKLKDVFGKPLDYNPRRATKTLNNIVLIVSLLGEQKNAASMLDLLTIEVIVSSCFNQFYEKWTGLPEGIREVFLQKLLEQPSDLISAGAGQTRANFAGADTPKVISEKEAVMQSLMHAGRLFIERANTGSTGIQELRSLVAASTSLQALLFKVHSQYDAAAVGKAVRAWIAADPTQLPLKDIRRLVNTQLLVGSYSDYEKAIGEYSGIIARDPWNIRALDLRAATYEKTGEQRKAEADREEIKRLTNVGRKIILDNNLLIELGLGELPVEHKRTLLDGIYEILEARVGIELARRMSDQQLIDFEDFVNENSESAALDWLEGEFPDYRDTVADEFEMLKADIKAHVSEILKAPETIKAILASHRKASKRRGGPTDNETKPTSKE